MLNVSVDNNGDLILSTYNREGEPDELVIYSREIIQMYLEKGYSLSIEKIKVKI